MSGSANPVSVIINTLDRAEKLRDTLIALDSLVDAAVEVVVVKGPCKDHTSEVLQDWQGRIVVASCADANLSRSRNIGLAASSGQFAAFIDDDAVPHPRWIAELLAAYADPAVAAVGGHTIGRQGTSYQARGTLCDRNGDPYFVADELDLAPFNQAGSWLFPSLLGTNCSFRRSALEAVGGFDETFSYYLEETDLCLRLVDAGWKIAFAPRALVWHQFASSAQRAENTARRSIEAIIRSHSYFINRHAVRPWTPALGRQASERLTKLAEHWARGIAASAREGAIDDRHASFLSRELDRGLVEGHALAQARSGEVLGHWHCETAGHFLAFGATAPSNRMTIAFICRDFGTGAESGIPSWTGRIARALAQRGHRIHIVAEARDDDPQIRFANGVWLHAISADATDFGWVAERHGLPPAQAQWAASVHRHLPILRSFGLEILSFPLWDLEGIACRDEPGFTTCMSLHTSYGISASMKPEWAYRPLMREATAARMIAAENRALQTMPHLLANSRSIILELGRQANAELAGKAHLAGHGYAPDEPIPERPMKHSGRILFVGRFEHRKGIDLAIKAILHATRKHPEIEAVLVGGESLPPELTQLSAPLVATGQLKLPGIVSRAELSRLYASSQIALLPSRYESFGLVAIEAMAHGCAVVSLDSGGISEIVEAGRTGILVPLDEHSEFALGEALLNLLADASALVAMQKLASETVKTRFSEDRMAEEVEQGLFRFLDKARSEEA